MRIALFGDIHSNHLALEACLREAKGFAPEAWVFLGDYVSDCAYPERTMELMRGETPILSGATGRSIC